jgi:hypothetical protein
MTLHDYREILDRMASLNGRRLTAATKFQVCALGSYLALEAYIPVSGFSSKYWLLVFMFRIDDRRSLPAQAVCTSFRRAHGLAPPHKYRSVDPLLPLLLHPPEQPLHRQ